MFVGTARRERFIVVTACFAEHRTDNGRRRLALRSRRGRPLCQHVARRLRLRRQVGARRVPARRLFVHQRNFSLFHQKFARLFNAKTVSVLMKICPLLPIRIEKLFVSSRAAHDFTATEALYVETFSDRMNASNLILKSRNVVSCDQTNDKKKKRSEREKAVVSDRAFQTNPGLRLAGRSIDVGT